MGEYLLEMKNINKSFGGIKVLKDVNFNLRRGEVLGLCGENGAGKSTLMKILCGLYSTDTGKIFLDGQEVCLDSPRQAQKMGVAMIPQEILLVQELSVMENIFLGYEKVGKLNFLKKSQMVEHTKKLLADLNSSYIQPDFIVGTLSKAHQQLIAIARRIQQGGKIFILDEPTAALTEKETKSLFEVIRTMCDKGCSAIFISHRLEEVIEICNRVTVLRDGELVTTLDKTDEIDKRKIIYHMVGSEINDEFPHTVIATGQEIIKVENLAIRTFQGNTISNINFSIHECEVVGITGLVGVGKTELGQTLMGIRKPLQGRILIDGRAEKINSPVKATKAGFGYVSEDRRGEGLVLGLESLYNMTLSSLSRIAKLGVMSAKKEIELGESFVPKLAMKPEYLFRESEKLSGGNQQKIVIVRQIVSGARIIILDEPTKGIDVNAKSEVARIISDLSKERKAILLLSSEPREVLGISDRIYILTAHGLEGPFQRGTIDYAQLMAIEFEEKVGLAAKQ